MAITHVEKLLMKIEKAQDALLDICDELDVCMADCQLIGGEIGKQVPSHLQSLIDKITQIVESTDPSSLNNLEELIVNMPIRAVKSQTPSERRESRAAVNLNPNTAAGPQSAMKESSSFDWKAYGKEPEPYIGGLNWDKLQEHEEFQSKGSELTEAIIGRSQPIDSFSYKQQIRETIDNKANEDLENIQEAATVSGGSLNNFDLSQMVGISGTEDGLPSFGSLREEDDINIVG